MKINQKVKDSLSFVLGLSSILVKVMGIMFCILIGLASYSGASFVLAVDDKEIPLTFSRAIGVYFLTGALIATVGLFYTNVKEMMVLARKLSKVSLADIKDDVKRIFR